MDRAQQVTGKEITDQIRDQFIEQASQRIVERVIDALSESGVYFSRFGDEDIEFAVAKLAQDLKAEPMKLLGGTTISST